MWRRFRNWHSNLSRAGKALFAAGAVTVGVIGLSAAAPDAHQKQDRVLIDKTKAAQTEGTAAHEPAKKEPKIETKTVTETEAVVYEKTTVEDPALEKGKTTLRTAGKNGIKTRTYEITVTDGVEGEKKLVKEEITTAPINEVTAIGTKVQSASCDPNYSGCVPIASDVDCAGGSGNGPAYVRGPIQVIGTDIYDLDHDGDGIACE